MPNESPLARNAMTAAAAMLLVVLLGHPGLLLCVPPWTVLFFESGAAVLAITGIALLFPRTIQRTRERLPHGLGLAMLLLFGVGLWHGIRHAGRYSIAETGELFLISTVPFCICAFATEIKRYLAWFLTLFWLLDAVNGFIQYYGLGWHLFGMAQNINWNAALLAVTAPFAVLTLVRTIRRHPLRLELSAIVVGVTVWQIALTESRGAVLGIIVAGALWGFLKLGHRGRRITLFSILTAAIVGSLWFGLMMPHDAIIRELSVDERVFLANTTVNMIAEHPNLGVGGPSFETEYLPFRRPEFFAMRHSAVRIDHPHNQPLFVAASFGLLGLLCWCYLLLEPMYFAGKRFRELDAETALALLCLTGLLVHCQFDLVLERWPTNLLAMIFLGLLLHEREGVPAPFWRPPEFLRRFLVQRKRELEPDKRRGRILRPASFALGAVVLLLALFSAFCCLAAELLSWQAGSAEADGDHDRASRLHLAAASMPCSPLSLKSRSLYHASLHDPANIGKYYAMFAASSTPDYGYSNDYIARACVISGHPAEAIPFLKRAMELRPVSVLPLIMLESVYRMTDREGAADAVRERLAELATYRNLDSDDLNRIMEDQDLDLHTWFKRDPKLMKENHYE